MKLQDALAEIESLNDLVEEEQSSKMTMQNKMSKINSELQSIKSKFDEEGKKLWCYYDVSILI